MDRFTALFLNSALISRLSWSSSAVIFSTGKLGASSCVRISAGVIVLVSLAPGTSDTYVRVVKGQRTFAKLHVVCPEKVPTRPFSFEHDIK